MTSTGNLLEWEFLRDTYLKPGVPILQPILHDPEFSLEFSAVPRQFGMRLRLSAGQELPNAIRLRNITIGKFQVGEHIYARVMTDSEELFMPLHGLIRDAVQRIEDGEKDCLRALTRSLATFEDLVARAMGLSREEVLGLYGELLVLESLVKTGANALAWIGHDRNRHDFRLPGVELEIKTTATNNRCHIIHGLNQLDPSPGYDLYLISVKLESAGGGSGRCLDQLVKDLLGAYSSSPSDAQYIDDALKKFRYERGQYESTVVYQLASPLMQIAIGKDFPVLNAETYVSTLGGDAAGRIQNVNLTLNMEGLGMEFLPSMWVGSRP